MEMQGAEMNKDFSSVAFISTVQSTCSPVIRRLLVLLDHDKKLHGYIGAAVHDDELTKSCSMFSSMQRPSPVA